MALERTRRGEYGTDTESQVEQQTGPANGSTEQEAGWVKKAKPLGGGKFFKFQNIGDTIQGTLKGFFESTFEGKTSNNALLVVDGKDISFRMTTQLEQYFTGVTPGTVVKVEYKGRLGKMKTYDFYTAG